MNKTSQLKTKNLNAGYAILFTMVIVSVMSGISMGLANSMFKEMVISSIARDSQVAFYEADTAVECILYAERGSSGMGGGLAGLVLLSSNFDCGTYENGDPMTFSVTEDSTDFYTINPVSNSLLPISDPCFKGTVDANNGMEFMIRGYNTCDSNNPRQVERGVKVTY